MAQKVPHMIPDPPLLIAKGSFGGLSSPDKAPTISIRGAFIKFSEYQVATKSPLLMTFCRRFWTRNLYVS